MSPIASRLASVTLWVVPVAILAAVIGLETDWGRALRPALPADAPVSPAPVTAVILPGTSLVGGLDTLSATVERPLFNATRKPAPPAIVEAPKATIQRGQFTLTGTMVADGVAIAYLRDASGGGKTRSVRKGESINGMVVADVGADRVRLKLGEETEDLDLKVAKGPKVTAPAVAATPAAAPAGTQPAIAAQTGAVPVGAGTGRGGRVRGSVAQAGAPGTDGAENLRAARRAARNAEAQQNTAAGADGQAQRAQPVTPQQSWDATYDRMRQRPK